MLAMGVRPESFEYRRKLAKCKNSSSEPDKEKQAFLPSVLETAFGWLGPEAKDSRRIFAGANWSPGIKNLFRGFGSTSEGLETALAKLYATRDEPVVYVLHAAQPRLQYTDRGKSAIVIGGAS